MIDPQPASEPSESPKSGVPQELLTELHDANKQLSHARENLEEAIDANVNSFAKRDDATRELHDAEERLETVDEKIAQELKKT